MADDRVLIRCKGCGGWKMLLKHYATTGPVTWDNDILLWLDKHARCHPHSYSPDLHGDPGFELFTESGQLDPKKQHYVPELEDLR